MKTFLRTSLSRIVIAITFLILLGFGNLVPKGLILDDYHYLVKMLPDQMKEEIANQAVSDYQHAETQVSDPTTTPEDPAKLIETDGESNATTLPARL
ncbi:MAG: hypothetical protein LBD11_06890, partial [Candidatus Peribacteria bacterium]|nr:hypothetical protein [Candidatus Peribacteria bacterium]